MVEQDRHRSGSFSSPEPVRQVPTSNSLPTLSFKDLRGAEECHDKPGSSRGRRESNPVLRSMVSVGKQDELKRERRLTICEETEDHYGESELGHALGHSQGLKFMADLARVKGRLAEQNKSAK